jgi:hypothetical protein
MRYNEPLEQHIPAAQLMKNAGGDCEFEYDHAIYWPTLVELAEKRKTERIERFEKAGKHIGESEIYLWGGDEPSVGAAEEKKQEETPVPAPAAEPAGEAKGENGTLEGVTSGVEKLDVKDSEANGTVKGIEAAPTSGAEEKVANDAEATKANGDIKTAA